MTSAARVEGLVKEFIVGEERVMALRGVTLDIPDGDFVAVMGPSGSGKSTLLNVLGCLDRPTGGKYFLGADDVARLSDDRLSEVRASRLGFIFQSFNLIPQLTVIENIEVPLHYRGRISAADRARCRELAARVGLSDRLKHRPVQLSGGQQQRCAIARSLVNEPRMLLADEPTGNLDSKTAKEILEFIVSLNEEGRTIVLVTHDEGVARRARRIVRFLDGEIAADERLR